MSFIDGNFSKKAAMHVCHVRTCKVHMFLAHVCSTLMLVVLEYELAVAVTGSYVSRGPVLFQQ